MDELPWAETATLCRRPIDGSASSPAVIMKGTLQAVAKAAGLMPALLRQSFLVALPTRTEAKATFEGPTLDALIGSERAGWRARKW